MKPIDQYRIRNQPMKFIVAAVLSTGLAIADVDAQEAGRANVLPRTPLLDDGRLQDVRKPLEQLFQFSIEGPAVIIDRQRWPKANPNELIAEPGGGNRFGRGRSQPSTPIEFVFHSIQEQSQANSRGASSGSSGGARQISRHFTGDSLSGSLHTRGDSIRLILVECQDPKRTLEFVDENDVSFRIQLSHPDGDLLFINQSRSGRFSVVMIAGGRLFAGDEENYLAFYRKHRREVETQISPTLSPLGVAPFLSPHTPKLRNAVFDLLRRTPETLAEGKKLIAELDSEDFSVRERASRSLTQRLGFFKDLVKEKHGDKSISPEVSARLKSILSSRSEGKRDEEALAAFDLINDAGYLASLLDHASPSEANLLVGRLEKITGRKLGTNPAAWKDWAKKNQD